MKSSVPNETLALALAGLLAAGGSAAAHELFSAEPVATTIKVAHAEGEQAEADRGKAVDAEPDADDAGQASATAEKTDQPAAMPEGNCGAAHMKANEGRCGGHR